MAEDMQLEQQIKILSELGLHLNPEIMIDDLLYSHNREVYEEDPFVILLFRMGGEVEREPWGRRISPNIWYFDTECIYSTGEYTRILKHLCLLSGDENYFTEIEDRLDFEEGWGWLRYCVNGKPRQLTVDIVDDWADMLALHEVMEDLRRGDKRFYEMWDGQAVLLLYIDELKAIKIKTLAGFDLQPI